MTTVGYGDIGSHNTFERWVNCVAMVLGVIAFSFSTGTLASILQSYDASNREYAEKMTVLNKIYQDYQLPLNLYIKCQKAIGFSSTQGLEDIENFLKVLPTKLKADVSMHVYEGRYKQINYLSNKSKSFIIWMSPLLKPQLF